jgi:hypothetical protein
MLSKNQQNKLKRYGKVPLFMRLADRQMRSKDLSKPRVKTNVNGMEQMWSDATARIKIKDLDA